jgi:hypothetical protein
MFVRAVHCVQTEVLDYFPNASMSLPGSGNADGLAAKLAWQTLSGVAMGWANDAIAPTAAGGGAAADSYNGSGTVDWLARPEGRRERGWLQRLASLRRGAGRYLVHGRRARDVLPHNGSAANRTFGPIRLPSLQVRHPRDCPASLSTSTVTPVPVVHC